MIYLDDEQFKLYNGDCIEILKNNDIKFDKVITSPPYNIIRPSAPDMGYDEYKDRLMTNSEYSNWICKLFNLLDEKMNKNGCVLFNMSYGSENTTCMSLTIAEILKQTNFTLADILVWKKKSATPNNVSKNKMTRICEFVYVFCRKDEFHTFNCNKKVISYSKSKQAIYENVYNYFEAKNNDGATNINMATFSTDFVQHLIDRYILKDDVVLDCFSGTGTTIVSCIQNGIKSIGIELSEKQCEYTKNRISNVQLKLF